MELKLTGVIRVKTGTAGTVCFAIPPSRRFEYEALVKKGQPKDLYDVVISTPRLIRSTGYRSQNAHLNGHVGQISHETGQDFEAVKLYAKRAAIPQGLPLKTKPNGDILLSIVDGQPVPISETEMDTVQCGWVIDACHVLASELGIALVEN